MCRSVLGSVMSSRWPHIAPFRSNEVTMEQFRAIPPRVREIRAVGPPAQAGAQVGGSRWKQRRYSRRALPVPSAWDPAGTRKHRSEGSAREHAGGRLRLFPKSRAVVSLGGGDAVDHECALQHLPLDRFLQNGGLRKPLL